MSRPYYKVGPSIWIDHPWNDDERLVAFYILTCPHRTTEGLFRMPLEYAIADLGWTRQRFVKAFDKLVADGFIEYDERAAVCLIVSALKWQAPENPNQVKAAMKAIAKLPETTLLSRFRGIAETLSPRLAEAFAQPVSEAVAPGLVQGESDPPTPPPPPSYDRSANRGGGAGAPSRIDDDEILI